MELSTSHLFWFCSFDVIIAGIHYETHGWLCRSFSENIKMKWKTNRRMNDTEIVSKMEYT